PIDSSYDYTTFPEVVRCGQDAYQQAGVSDPREEISLAEVHDCFTPTELVLMEDLGFSERGTAWSDELDGAFDLDGRLPVNPDRGLQPGDRVALLGANAAETVEQIAGIALGGFTRAALYAHNAAETNAYLADLVDARLLIVEESLAEGMLALRDDMPQLEHVIVYRAGDYEDVLAAASPEDPGVTSGPDDLHVIRFSAGTTGKPKGIVHTNERWSRAMDEYRWC